MEISFVISMEDLQASTELERAKSIVHIQAPRPKKVWGLNVGKLNDLREFYSSLIHCSSNMEILVQRDVQTLPGTVLNFTESQNVRGWKGHLWVI